MAERRAAVSPGQKYETPAFTMFKSGTVDMQNQRWIFWCQNQTSYTGVSCAPSRT